MCAQLIITTRNRTKLLKKTLESALAQSAPFNRIIVSDNSSKMGSHVKEMSHLKQSFEKTKIVQFIKTQQELGPHEHLKYIQNKYIPNDRSLSVLFHDDDEFCTDYHEEILKAFDQNQDCVAVSCNAMILRGDMQSEHTLMRSNFGTKKLTSKLEFFSHYFGFNPIAPPPFSAYCCRSDIFKNLNFSPDLGGKYSDVAGLSQLLDHGSIFWINTPLMKYRLHENQDSRQNHIVARRKLLRYAESQLGKPQLTNISAAYKTKYLMTKLSLKSQYARRSSLILRYILSIFLTEMMTSWQFYKFLWAVLFRKERRS